MSVGIKGTAGDVPRDNTTIEKKTFGHSHTARVFDHHHTSVEEKVMRLHRQHFLIHFELHFAEMGVDFLV